MKTEEKQAKGEKLTEVVLKVPKWVLKHKRASFVLWMVDDTCGLEVDQEFHYFAQDLKLAETIKREAVEEFLNYFISTIKPAKEGEDPFSVKFLDLMRAQLDYLAKFEKGNHNE